MASYGFLGAIQGGAKSVSDSILMKMEEAKEGRLAELRGSVNRETNTQNNDQRHTNTMAEHEQRHGNAVDLQGRKQENTLSQLKVEDQYDTAQKTTDIANKPTFTHQLDSDGNLSGQVDDQTNEWSRAGETSGVQGSVKPVGARMIDYLEQGGMDKQEATSLVMSKSGMSKEEFRRSLISKFADEYRYPARHSQINKTIETLMEQAYPEETPKSQYGFQELFDGLKARNAGKFSDDDLKAYIKKTYGVSPE